MTIEELIQKCNVKNQEKHDTVIDQKLPDLKSINLILMQAQAEITEKMEEKLLILFGAIADIYENEHRGDGVV